MTTLVLKPPYRLENARKDVKSIFLAGSIEMGKAQPWQDQIAEALKGTDVVVFNPRRDDWDSSWKQDPKPGTKFHEQVTWELDHIEKADLVVFYFDPKTKSPITLMELGICLNLNKPVLVCCPDGYFRKGNVVITAKRHDTEVLNTLDDLISKIKAFLK